jgi:hypothetical protein
MNSKTLNKLMKRPHEFQKVLLRGGRVSTRRPEQTPLLILLSRIPPRLRMEFKGIRVTPSLGYSGGLTFNNAHQLYRWLGGEETELLASEHLPSESRIIRSFRGPLSLETLSNACASAPSEEMLKRGGFR